MKMLLVLCTAAAATALTPCQNETQNLVPNPGGYVPRCEADGSYVMQQRDGSDVFCVNPDTGDKTGAPLSSCDMLCDAARNIAYSSNNMNRFVPVCDDDGKRWRMMQCKAGGCYCVDVSTGITLADNASECGYNCSEISAGLRNVTSTPLIGQYIPQCTAEGAFTSRQCHGSTGKCWCVDPVTGVKNGKTGDNCDTEASTPCQVALNLAVTMNLVGGFTPNCTTDGMYAPRQCQGGTHGWCWCVDTLTGEKTGMTGDACDVAVTTVQTCAEKVADLKDKPALIGAFVPKCADDGSYLAKQCWGSTGTCFCVDTLTGEKNNMSLTTCSPVTTVQTCAEKVADLKDKPALIGAFVPKCADDGSYLAKQCWGSTGTCFCVDTLTGEKNGMTGDACDVAAPKPLTCTEKMNMVSTIYIPGAVYPKCTADGSYEPKQCNNLGECFCVDTLTGEKNNMSLTTCSPVTTVQTCAEKVADLKDKPALIGAFVPKCADDGSYLAKQCWGSTGTCFCVDTLTGEKNNMSLSACSPVTTMQTCAEKVADLKDKPALLGAFVPKCADDGSYLAKQCWGSTGTCFCVDTLTGEKNNMSLSACSPVTTVQTCAEKVADLKDKPALIGTFVPKCADDGSYLAKQCWGSTGTCFCVDTLTGEKNNMSLSTCSPVTTVQTCAEKVADLKDKPRLIGAFVPKCADDGSYLAKQCWGSTGTCFCVDTLTGEKNNMSLTTCSPVTTVQTCAEKVADLKDKPALIGAFVPKCADDGSYLAKQCWGSTGTCFCVDTLTGEKNGMTGDACDVAAPKPLTCTEKMNMVSTIYIPGAVYPKCTADGSYEPKQCNNLGECFCVDTLTGEKNNMSLTTCSPVTTVQTCAEKVADLKDKPALIGAFVPKCADDGSYLAKQCWGSTGTCFCVDTLTGEKNNMSLSTCSPVTTVQTCAEKVADLKDKPRLIGAFVPKCADDGSYLAKQCWGSTGTCFCVDTLTGEKNNMSLSACSPVTTVQTCAEKVADLKDKPALFGAFVPKCADDGSYLAKQCWGSTGTCFCVDTLTGEKNNMSLTECAVSSPPTCAEKAATTSRSSNTLVGHYTPQCAADGSYLAKQCWGSTGQCWCVDTLTGEKNNMSLSTCSPVTTVQTCAEKVADLKDKPALFGAFVPKCADDGSYLAKQCWGSTGTCFCVDTLTGEKNNMSLATCSPVTTVQTCAEKVADLKDKPALFGAFVPKCADDGSYLAKQCWGSTGTCFCVDTLTGEKNNMSLSECSPVTTVQTCAEKVADLKEKPTLIGAFVPKCADDGSYLAKQCWGSTGTCFCVDTLTGEKTGMTGDACDVAAPKPLTCTEKMNMVSTIYIPGAYTPKCTSSGAYEAHQCNNLGECFCVDTLTGAKNNMSLTTCTPTTTVDNTTEAKTHCQRTQHTAQNRTAQNHVGVFEPKCNAHGHYEKRQCSGSIRSCWCVDELFGERTGMKGDSCNVGECFLAKKLAVSKNASYVPICEEDGTFAKKQCFGEKCFCVDGHQHQTINKTRNLTECEETKCARHRREGTSDLNCTKDGKYKTVQCTEADCRCVDPEGSRMEREACRVIEGDVVTVLGSTVTVKTEVGTVEIEMDEVVQVAQGIELGSSLKVPVGSAAPSKVLENGTAGEEKHEGGSSPIWQWFVLSLGCVAGVAAVAFIVRKRSNRSPAYSEALEFTEADFSNMDDDELDAMAC